jgi:hypothetical protein
MSGSKVFQKRIPKNVCRFKKTQIKLGLKTNTDKENTDGENTDREKTDKVGFWRQTDAFKVAAPPKEKCEYESFKLLRRRMTAFCNKETFEMLGKQQSAETFRKKIKPLSALQMGLKLRTS